jgi:hypothetical protein
MRIAVYQFAFLVRSEERGSTGDRLGSSATNRVRHRARMLAPSSYAGTKTVSGEGGTCGLARLWSLSPNSENSTKDVPEWPRDRRLRDWNTAAAYRRGAPWLLLPS